MTKLCSVADRLRGEGIPVKNVGIGSTPSCSHAPSEEVKKLTEIHPGNYAFYDVMQMKVEGVHAIYIDLSMKIKFDCNCRARKYDPEPEYNHYVYYR